MILIKLLAVITMLAGFPDTVSTQINGYFAEALKGYDSYTVDPVNLPENTVSVKFLSNEFDKEKKIVSIPAQVKMENGKEIKTFLSFKLKLFRKVLIANSTIEKSSQLKADNVIMGVTEVNAGNRKALYSISEIENCIATKKFLPGEVLCRDYIEKAPVIKAGDKVRASLVSGNTVISFDAVSRQDGRENEIIRVITPDKKLYKVKVINSNNVSVAE
jgi:flagella basal body P-ring formation protein FlgA